VIDRVGGQTEVLAGFFGVDQSPGVRGSFSCVRSCARNTFRRASRQHVQNVFERGSIFFVSHRALHRKGNSRSDDLSLNLLQQLNILRMAGQVSDHPSANRPVEKVKITDEIKNFVTGKLIGKPSSVLTILSSSPE